MRKVRRVRKNEPTAEEITRFEQAVDEYLAKVRAAAVDDLLSRVAPRPGDAHDPNSSVAIHFDRADGIESVRLRLREALAILESRRRS